MCFLSFAGIALPALKPVFVFFISVETMERLPACGFWVPAIVKINCQTYIVWALNVSSLLSMMSMTRSNCVWLNAPKIVIPRFHCSGRGLGAKSHFAQTKLCIGSNTRCCQDTRHSHLGEIVALIHDVTLEQLRVLPRYGIPCQCSLEIRSCF